MKIACISDTHQHHKKIIMPKCDVIVHAGDFTYHGKMDETTKFLDWYADQKSEHKILICGNHEVEISKTPDVLEKLCQDRGIVLLHNSHVIIDGVKFFGSPYTPTFGHGWAYMGSDDSLMHHWNVADGDVDVLVTHGPAFGKLDRTLSGVRAGSKSLHSEIHGRLWNLKLHIFGHIHEDRGTMLTTGFDMTENYLAVNASICGIPYTDTLLNPIVVEI